jgi:hypothetical protein
MRCKPGDQAVVIEPPEDPEFVGAFCRVVEPGPNLAHPVTGIPMPSWTVDFSRDMPWREPHPPLNLGLWPDAWLQPIRGDAPAEAERSVEHDVAWG